MTPSAALGRKLACPQCASPLGADEVNVQTDVAMCSSCGFASRPSELLDSGFDGATHRTPPAGAWFRQTMSDTVIGASTRHPIAFFLVPFICVWSGFSLGGIYGTQIVKGEFNLFQSLFGLPFLGGTLLFGSIALMAVCGKVEVRLRGKQGAIFVGVGSLGWKRPINLEDVRSIREDGGTPRYPGSQGTGIVLEGKSRLRFATNLNEARRHFMLNALRAAKAGKLA